MNFIKENKFLSIFLGVVILLLIAITIFLVTSIGNFNKEKNNYRKIKRDLIRLKSLDVFPSQANLDTRKKSLEQYRNFTQALEDDLVKNYQQELVEINNTEFGKKLKNKATEIQILAKKSGVDLTPGFYLGMENYRNTLPLTSASPKLNYQLDAFYHLMQVVILSGVNSVTLTRESLPQETNPNYQPSYVEKMKFQLDLVSTQIPLNKIIDELSNSKNYFFLIRAFRIDNEKSLGPEKLRLNAEIDENNTEQELDIGGDKQIGIAIGKEKLFSRLNIELIRFNPPKTETNDSPPNPNPNPQSTTTQN